MITRYVVQYTFNTQYNFLTRDHGIVITDKEILLHLLWADDLVLISDTAKGLQTQLDGLFTFCSRFQLIVNTLKTKVMLFGKGDAAAFRFHFNNKEVELCDQYKYLGVIFNSVRNLNGNCLRDSIQYAASQALKASFATLKRCSTVGKVTPKIGIHMFDSCVTPILEYACELWGRGRQHMELERIHLKFLKMLLGVKGSTASAAVYAETGRFPLHLRQTTKIIKYFMRVQSLPSSKIVKQIFNSLKHLDSLGFRTWFTDVREILEKWDLQVYIYKEHFSVAEISNCMSVLRDKLQQDFLDSCMKEIETLPALRSYRLFKHEHNLDYYLLYVRDFGLRKVLSKFRLSSHCLAIERGRHVRPKIPPDNRLCTFCDLHKIEDEIHFLTECPLYQEERNKFYNVLDREGYVLKTSNNESLFCQVMKLQGSVPFYLSLFISKCFKKRESCQL